MDRNENNQYESEPGWDTGIHIDDRMEVKPLPLWAWITAGIAVVISISMIAAMSDQGNEFSAIKQPGEKHEPRAHQSSMLSNSAGAAVSRARDCVLQNGAGTVKPAVCRETASSANGPKSGK
jgi:hypothetical protein